MKQIPVSQNLRGFFVSRKTHLKAEKYPIFSGFTADLKFGIRESISPNLCFFRKQHSFRGGIKNAGALQHKNDATICQNNRKTHK